MNQKKKVDVYVTRSTLMRHVRIFPTTVGIRKFHGCIAWGAAWCKECKTHFLRRQGMKLAEALYPDECRTRFGFYPREGTAWLVEYNAKGKMKKSKVDIDFSD